MRPRPIWAVAEEWERRGESSARADYLAWRLAPRPEGREALARSFAADVGRNPPIDAYFGVGVSIPLRIFDRNQGEKLRTQLDIDRNQKLADATQAQVFSDVDSAYAAVNSTLILLRPYKAKYLQQAVRVRETVRFSWEHGGASLLDFLNAEQDYRGVQLSYANLVGTYLTAAAQLNMAVGREVIQ